MIIVLHNYCIDLKDTVGRQLAFGIILGLSNCEKSLHSNNTITDMQLQAVQESYAVAIMRGATTNSFILQCQLLNNYRIVYQPLSLCVRN